HPFLTSCPSTPYNWGAFHSKAKNLGPCGEAPLCAPIAVKSDFRCWAAASAKKNTPHSDLQAVLPRRAEHPLQSATAKSRASRDSQDAETQRRYRAEEKRRKGKRSEFVRWSFHSLARKQRNRSV